ncbi:MAG: DNA polymerase III subunit delta, partial [Erysipelotrichaceae bacterium]|nr:DNA polymerase III subunit delta [Erysipelotrichaceae bacterium]
MIYYIHGSEPYLVRKELHKLMDSKKAQGVDVNPIFYDGSDNKEFDMRIVVQEAQTFDLFAGYRMLIVQDLNLNGMSSNPLVKRNAEVLLEYAKNASPDSDLIIYGNITTKSKTFVKDLRKYAKEITCEQLKYPEFFAQVKEQLKKNNIVMKPRLMEEFASRLELDLGRLMNEIEKFKLYGKEIDKEALDALVYKPLDDDVFALMNAIYSSDFERAMKQWNDLCALNLSPVMLSAIMVSSVRSAYIA